jgi:dipeptidyl aminopeptidase/acylaminoacyl peptidase
MRLTAVLATGRFSVRASGLLAAALILGSAVPAEAQYFGRNKVQYDQFEFEVMATPHFDIHYYPEAGVVVEDVSRMAERWYERYARLFQHEFEKAKPLVLYADHPDFQQTNTLQGLLGEGIGGVTESLKNRVIMPMSGSYQDTDHVLGHELVHAFQYNIAQSGQGVGLQGLVRLPGWLVEGMAEYLSVGRDDPLTAMWVRDAARRDDIPSIDQMTREMRYFPYRFGQALWAYVGGQYGDDAVIDLFRRSLRLGWDASLKQVLGVGSDTLSAQWAATIKEEYLPLMEGRSAPSEVGELLLGPSKGSGKQNLAPSLGPNGQYVVYTSEKDLFSFNLFLADANTGQVTRTLSSANADPHFDALRFTDSSGAWSWDAKRLAFVVFADGDNQMVVVDVENGDVQQRIAIEGIGAMQGPSWSPDGRYLVFSGSEGGITDLFLYDVEAETTTKLTNDKNADFQPVISPDGRYVAYTTDRSSDYTDFETLTYAKFQLAILDLETGQVEELDIFGPGAKHINPQYAPGGEHLYFISDVDGFSDIYRLGVRTGQVERITKVATGVSGITWSAPAMTVAQNTGELAFSVFDQFEFHVYTLTPEEALAGAETVAVASTELGIGRNLPPTRPRVPSRIAIYLDDADTGLEPPGTFLVEQAEDYDGGLHLDFIGQPTVGIGADSYGSYIGGGASAYFSDMLGNKIMALAFSAQGTFKDIGAQIQYMDQERRWNWGGAIGRIPMQYQYYGYGVAELDGVQYQTVDLTRYRIFLDSATGVISYPFSLTKRLDFSGGFSRYSFDLEKDQIIYDQYGQIIKQKRIQLDELEPPAQNMVNASVALVGDNSFSAFTSPIMGGRYRFEIGTTFGTTNFQTVTIDYRRYFQPDSYLTVAVRGLHYGRYNYGEDLLNSQFLQPLFLGYETLIRGYSYESLESRECAATATADGGCPIFDRLFGQRLSVANLEFRIPFIGNEVLGLINLPYVPMELVVFTDVGVAWDPENPVTNWGFVRTGSERVPLWSSGVSARFNLLGMMVFEAYWAYPWQRPEKGGHWGFSLAPGW